MKKILVIIIFFLSALAIQSQNSSIKLSGHIKGLKGADVVLLNADRTEMMRVKGKGDHFSIKADVPQGDGRVYYLYVPALGSLGPSMNIAYFYFFIDADNIKMDAEIKGKDLKKISIKNSFSSNEYDALFENNSYQRQIKEVGDRYNKAFHEYNDVKQSEANKKMLKTTSDSLELLYREQYRSFLEMTPTHRRSDALFLILYSSGSYENVADIKKFLGRFDDDLVKNNYYAKLLQRKMNLIKSCEVGAIAPDFVLSNLKGESVKLSSFRGKYVLVDFWASWCGPCRKEIPNVKKIYEEYKNHNLQVVGVSIDTDEGKWRKAVDEEQVKYLQLWDPKRTTGELYNYRGIPFIVLISPDGKILAKQLRGEMLRQTVNKHLNEKPFEITVNLASPRKGKVYLAYVKQRFTKIDSLNVDGTSFAFKGVIDKPELYRVIGRRMGFDVSVCVEPGGTYLLNIDSNGSCTISTSNGKEQLLMNEYLESKEPLEMKISELNKRYSQQKEQKKDLENVQKQMSDCYYQGETVKMNFIKKYPRSFAAMVVAGDILTNKYTELHDIYNVLDTVRYAYSYCWASFKSKYQEAAGKWIQNKPAPDFVTKDIKGKLVKLIDFRGKYLLLDFWASWCRPCRAKMKELKAVYPKLLKKGIVVCSISLDDKRDQWLKASKEDGIVWINTCDLKAFKDNLIAKAYKVTNVPTLFVIDPNGVIMNQNPEIEEILAIH